MSRLIDADKLINVMNDRYNEKVNNVPDNLAEGFMQMEKLIKEQPTVFDVDKVCRKLNEYKDMDNLVDVDCAIEIVKAGGIGEASYKQVTSKLK